MDQEFAFTHSILLNMLQVQIFVVILSKRSTASNAIVEEFKQVYAVLGDFANVNFFTKISNIEHPILLGLNFISIFLSQLYKYFSQ